MTDAWTPRGAAEYAQAIEAELPTGAAWPRDTDSPLMRWVAGSAQVWGDVDARAATLAIAESDPRVTLELLPEWESAFGLPDACVSIEPTIEERRTALVTKLTTLGGQSRDTFLELAQALGYAITIYEYAPYTCGISTCGETRPDGGQLFTYSHCGGMVCGQDPILTITAFGGDEWFWELGAPEIRYYWVVKVQNARLTWLRGGTGECGQDHLCEFSNALDLECAIRRSAPAHTGVIFDYAEVEYSSAAAGTLDFSDPAQSALLALL